LHRPSSHAWSHPDLRAAVEETGRRKLIVAGLVTEVCVAQSVLAARKEGFDVYFVSDCCGGTTKEAHEDGKVRMTIAGAVPINWMSVGPSGPHTGHRRGWRRCHRRGPGPPG
jgi:nicotinamidase-related amidase